MAPVAAVGRSALPAQASRYRFAPRDFVRFPDYLANSPCPVDGGSSLALVSVSNLASFAS